MKVLASKFKLLKQVCLRPILLLVFISSCQVTPLTKKKESKGAEYTALNYQRAASLNVPLDATAKIINETDPVEQLDALARCDCGEKTKLRYFQTFNTTHGTLPQILVPTIRDQIRNDSKLQMLNALPAGLGNLLKGIFATDDKITEEIGNGLAEKLQKNTPGGTSVGKSPVVRLDGFVPLTQGTTPPNVFHLNEQIVRWALVFSTPNLFEGKAGVGGADHGPQTLELMRTLMEWNYMFGLDPRPDGGNYGGLTLDAAGDINNVAGAFDPRAMPDAKRFFSGDYSLYVQQSDSAINAAIQTRESWRVQHTGPVYLRDQARLWSAASFAFGRLRTDKRGSIAGMFGEKGVALFPNNAHELPLAFLPTLQALLDGGYIDKNERAIFAGARVGSFQSQTHASLGDIGYLVDAMINWTIQLRTVQSAQVNPASLDKLIATPGKFVPALQLASNRALSDNFYVDPAQIGVSIRTLNPADPKAAAEGGKILYALARAEQEVLKSPFIRDHIIGGLHWYAMTILQGHLTGQRELPFAGAVWALRALKQFKNYDQGMLQAPWLDPAIQKLESALATWDQSALNY